jgi:hypothetical protein
MVSKQQLDTALAAWEAARDRSAAEHKAYGALTQSHSALIASLRQHGHSWAQATAEFDKLAQGHSDAYSSALKEMERRRHEYNDLRRMFDKQ